jgi:hypothetical protein
MTPASIRADYAATMARRGEPVIVRVFAGVGPTRTHVDYATMARITGFNPHEIVGAIQQEDNKVIILAENLATAGMTGEIKINDKLIARGRTYNIEASDYNTRRVQGVLIATELRIRG